VTDDIAPHLRPQRVAERAGHGLRTEQAERTRGAQPTASTHAVATAHGNGAWPSRLGGEHSNQPTAPRSTMTPASARKRAMPYATSTAAPARTSPLTSSMSAWPSPAEPVPTWKLNAPSITCPSAEVTRQTTAYSPSGQLRDVGHHDGVVVAGTRRAQFDRSSVAVVELDTGEVAFHRFVEVEDDLRRAFLEHAVGRGRAGIEPRVGSGAAGAAGEQCDEHGDEEQQARRAGARPR
jgi:hypothetical protein